MDKAELTDCELGFTHWSLDLTAQISGTSLVELSRDRWQEFIGLLFSESNDRFLDFVLTKFFHPERSLDK